MSASIPPPASTMTTSTSTSTSSHYRLHLSPLPPTPTLPSSEIIKFFSRFGTPTTFERPGVDGLGRDRDFGYLGMDFGEKGEKGLSRCISMTSSSVWRGIKLKVSLAKPSYTLRLENEHNPPPPAPAVLEKRNRALKLKKRRDRKRRIADADGGRMDGDMRLVDEEIVQSGVRKHWHTVPGEEHTILRPIFTRPTHPLPPVTSTPTLVGSATSSTKPGPTTSSNATPLKRKKQRKSRTKPPVRAKRVWLDPTGWDRQYRVYGDEQVMNQKRETDVDGMWVWEEEEVDDDEIAGRWVFKVARAGSEDEVSLSGGDVVETVETREQRVRSVLQTIAKESIWPAEYLDITPTISGKGGKVRPQAKAKKEEVLRLEEMDVGGLEDEDGLWGAPTASGGMDGGLFDEPVVEVVSAAPIPARTERGLKRTVEESIDDEESELAEENDDVDGLGDDDLFEDVKQTSVSPLFGNTTLPTPSFVKRQKKGQALPSDISNDFTDAESDAASSSSGLFEDREATMPVSSKGMSLKEVVKTEKNTGLSVLSALGFDLDEARSDTPASKPKATIRQDESSSDESDWAPAMRLRGGATDAEMESASSSSSSSSGSGSSSSSSSDDSSSEDSDSSISSDEESSEEEDVEMTTETREVTRQQTLKDMFAPKADEAQGGFSLLAGLDLELDSDLEDETTVARPTQPEPVAPIYVPAPAISSAGKADLFAPEAGKPFFFFDTAKALAPPGDVPSADELGKKWLGSVQTLQGETIEVKPFVRTETDEQMTQAWRESKVELTREWKKRHREAVKRVKRGMGSGGANVGEFAD